MSEQVERVLSGVGPSIYSVGESLLAGVCALRLTATRSYTAEG